MALAEDKRLQSRPRQFAFLTPRLRPRAASAPAGETADASGLAAAFEGVEPTGPIDGEEGEGASALDEIPAFMREGSRSHHRRNRNRS